MRITDVTTRIIGTAWRNLVIVKVHTDEGVVGLGEATLQNREEAVVAFLDAAKKRHIIGSDPFNIEDLWLRMYRNDSWRGGHIANTVLSAVEIACWDIIGKVLDQPVYRLLGGKCHDSLKAYANGWYAVERTPETFHQAAKAVVARGYKALKVDPFGAGHYELSPQEGKLSVSLIEAIRDAVGPDTEIFIECHGRFSAATAIEVCSELKPFRPSWYEEPVPPENLGEYQRVAQVLRPIATGERLGTRFEFWNLLTSKAVDIIQPDLLHCGGLLEAKHVAAMADANYLTVAPHNSNSPLCTAITAHFCACTPNFKIQEVFDDFQEPWLTECFNGVPRMKDGVLPLPEGPGLGVTLNEDVIAEHPYRPMFISLWDASWHKRFAKDLT
ncbi:MAG: mandelate racemase/muconate lactonizing enzyme family protein [Verrucomicrobia bacterium]|nr:mandelate racemase/muconate lactonizing enzyme family protein [Verrucomicrobiota bacterium]